MLSHSIYSSVKRLYIYNEDDLKFVIKSYTHTHKQSYLICFVHSYSLNRHHSIVISITESDIHKNFII